MEELGIPRLTSEQTEKLCLTAEKTVRDYILSKVSPKRIEELNISVEIKGTKPVRLNVEVDVSLSPLMKEVDIQKIADEAVKEAFASAEKFLRELNCRSSK